ncbi:hypothetical protein chiPu_0015974 [Chiloscyllium punctatum]|uniref:Uncharacterized protein n=1 Tax=Chiloscyllium punctatum TaxID=137246 RepID=A0A401T4D7_CHIPU|nr:hypothetical protein [Chiloscyllium punctatum]
MGARIAPGASRLGSAYSAALTAWVQRRARGRGRFSVSPSPPRPARAASTGRFPVPQSRLREGAGALLTVPARAQRHHGDRCSFTVTFHHNHVKRYFCPV